MKKTILVLLASLMLLSLVACGGNGGKKSSSEPMYIVETDSLDPNAYPDDYPLIPIDKFEKGFEELKAANLSADIDGYQDVVDFFGVDGAYYINNDYEDAADTYKYYGWYADTGVSVLITFKANGDKLEYFAWTGNGIN